MKRITRGRGPDVAMAAVLAMAWSLRIYGLDWDRGLLFHPDERRILMVVAGLRLPDGLLDFFRVGSPLNPRFFAYGSFPLYLLRAVASALSGASTPLYVVARALSAAADTLTVWATYSLGRKLWSRLTGLLAATLVALTVLHIQLSHFGTVDTLLGLLVVLVVSKAVDVGRTGSRANGIMLGILLGMALATKFSAIPLVAVALSGWLASVEVDELADPTLDRRWRTVLAVRWRQVVRNWRVARSSFGRTLAVAGVTFLCLQPYALIDAYHFVAGVGTEIAMAARWADFPYTRQYVGTWPYLYHLRQLLLFGMGVPAGLLGVGGLLWWLKRWVRTLLHGATGRTMGLAARRDLQVWLTWPVLYGLSQGAAATKFIRYLLPLTPFLCLAGCAWWASEWSRSPVSSARRVFLGMLLIGILGSAVFYGLAFLEVYRKPHTWLQASSWLCDNLTTTSTVLSEVWDDPLPVYGLPGEGGCAQYIQSRRINLYTLAGEDGLAELVDAITSSDFIVLASDRLYAPVTRLADRYPLAARYYRALFSGDLGFDLALAPAVYPEWAGVVLADNPRAGLNLPAPPLLATRKPLGWTLDLGRADESFTVYDHPQPLIFVKATPLAPQALRELLTGR